MFSVSRYAALILGVFLVLSACSGSTGGGAQPGLPKQIRAAAQENPDLRPVVERLETGNCSEALALLRLYVRPDQNDELSEALLGLSYLCTGDVVKGAQHLERAYRNQGPYQAEIRETAHRTLDQLLEKSRPGTDFANQRTAIWVLAQMGDPTWYGPTLGQQLSEHAVALVGRGEYRKALRVVQELKDLGAPPGVFVPPMAAALLRMGRTEELLKETLALEPSLGEGASEMYVELASQAAAAFRHEAASRLLARAIELGAREPRLLLDLCSSYLKSAQPELGVQSCTQYLGAPDREGYVERLLEVVPILQLFEQRAEATRLLEQGQKAFPADFRLVQELARQDGRTSEERIALLRGFLEACDYSQEALRQVGEALLAWRRPAEGREIFGTLEADRITPNLRAFYLGAFLFLEGAQDKARQSFQSALGTPDMGAQLAEILGFLGRNNGSDLALSLARWAAKKAPEDLSVALSLANLLWERKQNREAQEGLAGFTKPPAKAGRLAVLSGWFLDHAMPERALELANQAVERAVIPQDKGLAYLALSRALQTSGDLTGAREAALNASKADPTNLVFARELAAVALAWKDGFLACEAHQSLSGANASERQPDDPLLLARLALRCGLSKDPFVIEEVHRRLSGNEEVQSLLLDVGAAPSARTLAGLLLEWSGDVDEGTYWALMMLTARYRDSDLTASIAARVVASEPFPGPRAVETAVRHLLVQSCFQAAREILEWSIQQTHSSDREAMGLLLASVCFSLGDEDAAAATLENLARSTETSTATIASAASLLMDFGRYKEARELLLQALGTRKDDGSGFQLNTSSVPAGLEALMSSPAIELSQDTAAGSGSQVLVSLLAYLWKEEGLSWNRFVEEVTRKVSGWHGQPLIARALLNIGQPRLALPLLTKAFQDSPRDLGILREAIRAHTLLMLEENKDSGKHRDAIGRLVAQFLNAMEKDRHATTLAADTLMSSGLFDLAAGYYRDLLESGTRDRELPAQLARALMSAGRFEDGSAFYQVAVTRSRCNADILRSFLEDATRVGRRELVAGAMEECVTRNPKDEELALMFLQFQSGPPGRQTLAEWLTSVYRTPSQELVPLARKLLEMGERDLAMQFLALLMKSRDRALLKTGLGMVFAEASRTRNTALMEQTAKRVAERSKDLDVTREAATLLFKYGLDEPAAELLEQTSGEDPTGRLLLANHYMEKKQTQKGLELMMAVFQEIAGKETSQDPSDALASATALELSFLRDQGFEAGHDQLLDYLLSRFPNNPGLLQEKVDRLLQLGQLPEAAERWAAMDGASLTDADIAQDERVLRRLELNGQMPLALRALEKRYQSRPGFLLLGRLLLYHSLTSNLQAVAALADSALRDDQFTPAMLTTLGRLLGNHGVWTTADLLLTEAITRGWDDQATLALAYESLVQVLSATRSIQRLEEITRLLLLRVPASDLAFRSKVASILANKELPVLAGKYFGLLEAVDGTSMDTPSYMMHLSMFSDDMEQALSQGLRLAATAKTLIGGLLIAGNSARRKLQFSLALQFYRKALEMDPTNFPLKTATSELELLCGDAEAAWKLIAPLQERRYRNDREEARDSLLRYRHLGLARKLLGLDPRPGDLLALALFELETTYQDDALATLQLLRNAPGNQPWLERLPAGVASFAHRLHPDTLARILEISCSGAQMEGCHYLKANQFLNQGDAVKAASELEAELAGNGSSLFYTLLGFQALLRKGHVEASMALFRLGSSDYPQDKVMAEFNRTLLSLLSEQDLSPESRQKTAGLGLEKVEEQLALDPMNFWALTQKSELYAQSGQLDQAISVYEEAALKQPWSAGLKNNLAYLLATHARELPRGFELVQQAIDLEPGNSAFYLDTLGWLYLQKGDLDKAEKHIREAITRSDIEYGSALAESLYHLGFVLVSKGNLPEAVKVLRWALYFDFQGPFGLKAADLLRLHGHHAVQTVPVSSTP